MKIKYTLLSASINTCTASITNFGDMETYYNNSVGGRTWSCSIEAANQIFINFTAVSSLFDYNINKNPQWRQDYEFTFEITLSFSSQVYLYNLENNLY
jgi:hypothetical protein